jgi:hypothetical protein
MIELIVTIESSQTVNGVTYTQEQLQQGLAQVRSEYNNRTGESLDDAEWFQWCSMQNLVAWYEQGKGSEPVPPTPITPQANWHELQIRLLSGELYPIYARLIAASFADPATATPASNANANNIAVAAGKLDQALQVTKLEAAVAAAVSLLLSTSNYVFTIEEKTLWNATIASLGFSAVMELQ